MKLLRTALIALSIAAAPVAAQWQTKQHSVPIGQGVGVRGFTSLGPCGSGIPFVGAGASTDPACGPLNLGTGGAITGNLPVQNLFNGTNADSSHFLSGTGWAVPPGTINGSGQAGQKAVFGGVATSTTLTGVPNTPVICDIISSTATTCNNGPSAANNGIYTVPSGASLLHVRMAGGGGGGGASNSGSGGGSGGNTTFSTFTAGGGGGGGSGASLAPGGPGGAPSGCSTSGTGITGVAGHGAASGANPNFGADGGDTPFFNGHGPGGVNAGGSNGVANTGGGGGGGYVGSAASGGGGGGSGGYCEVWIPNPAGPYSYGIGAGGTGGTGGSNVGGAGGSGHIIVEAYY